jgi:hypothetical protein
VAVAANAPAKTSLFNPSFIIVSARTACRRH